MGIPSGADKNERHKKIQKHFLRANKLAYALRMSFLKTEANFEVNVTVCL